jgi:hypothetical protein
VDLALDLTPAERWRKPQVLPADALPALWAHAERAPRDLLSAVRDPRRLAVGERHGGLGGTHARGRPGLGQRRWRQRAAAARGLAAAAVWPMRTTAACS